MRIKLTEKSINKAPPATGVLELWDSVLPGFGLRIYKSGRRRYFVMTRFAGQQIRRTIGAPEVLKLAEARDAARDVLKLIAKGVDPREADRLAKIEAARARSNSVRSVVEAYLDDRGKGGGFNLRSKHSLKQRLENHVLGAWGDRPITEITRVDVRQLVEGIARKHPIAANRVLAAVRRVFNWAVSKDRADASPCVGIEAPGVERKRERTLTDDEIRLVWQGAGQLGKISGGVVKMLLLTAARRAEIGGMKRHELVNGTWTLPASRSKNGRANALPLPDLAKNIL
ncbi:MAG: integrase arm-type DNA-binding domain-containing protein, partial [Candidatus Omnitrophica bacterium]|nr:integrase arm-type DNA-binding domain-containing protein [Candidatus Omnitrophota bacterium]